MQNLGITFHTMVSKESLGNLGCVRFKYEKSWRCGKLLILAMLFLRTEQNVISDLENSWQLKMVRAPQAEAWKFMFSN